jgi:hypothetical protein
VEVDAGPAKELEPQLLALCRLGDALGLIDGILQRP